MGRSASRCACLSRKRLAECRLGQASSVASEVRSSVRTGEFPEGLTEVWGRQGHDSRGAGRADPRTNRGLEAGRWGANTIVMDMPR